MTTKSSINVKPRREYGRMVRPLLLNERMDEPARETRAGSPQEREWHRLKFRKDGRIARLCGTVARAEQSDATLPVKRDHDEMANGESIRIQSRFNEELTGLKLCKRHSDSKASKLVSLNRINRAFRSEADVRRKWEPLPESSRSHAADPE